MREEMSALHRTTLLAAFALLTIPLAGAAETPKIGVQANTSFWWILDEEVENGLIQAGSGDDAADRAAGFNFKQGRIAFSFESPRRNIELFIRLRLEERTDVIDFWGAYHIAPWLGVSVGQMKIPSTAEVLTEDHALDFVSRTIFGRLVGDYALSRTPYISSVMAVKSYDRDLGIAFRGRYPNGEAPLLGYFLMVSNGIGANKYIGGRESNEFLFTNKFGDFYYGARLELTPVRPVTVGLHYSMNRHDEAALGERGPVYDLDRRVWTVDLATELPWGQRLEGFYGNGGMDDFLESQPYRFDYDGWGLWSLQPLFDGLIELGLRYDAFTTEFQEDGNETSERNWTMGMNVHSEEYLRLQLNYVYKKTVNEFEPDIKDNILLINFQFLFDAPLTE
jgi:hypothetical protein